jgi:FAD/FMN-containing dehydrogenase
VGGNLATNAGGTAALRYGTMRDLCLSLEYVNAQGQLCGSLHGLRKNNMGYDLRHLLIGSEGTLGIITTACLKLFPAPRSRCTAWLHVDTIHTAVAALQALQGRLYGLLSTYEWMNHAAIALVEQHSGLKAPSAASTCDHVLLECTALCSEAELQDTVTEALDDLLEHNPGVRNAVIAQNLSEAETLWALRERIPEAQARQGLNVKHDVAFEISKLGVFHDAALQALKAEGLAVQPILFGHLGDGNLHFNLAAPAGCDAQAFLQAHEDRIHELVYQCVQDHGGTPSAEHGIGQLKCQLLQSNLNTATYQQLVAIKTALDPHHLLNPGKMLG